MIAKELRTSQQSPIWSWLNVAWRLFVRELGRGDLTIIALSIILAVSSVMALSSVTDRVENAIMAKSAAFLAADRDIVSAHPIDEEYNQHAESLNIATDSHIYFSSMAFAGDAMNIAVIKAVSPSYPLRGTLYLTKAPLTESKYESKGP
jgi:putative ABC transport system permease protein